MKKIKLKIEYLVYLFIFLLPLQTAWIIKERFIGEFKWQQGTELFYGTEVLLWLIIIWQLVNLVRAKGFSISNWRLLKNDRRKLVINGLILFFIFWSGLSIFWSSDFSLSYYVWLKLLSLVALFFVVLTIKIDKIKIAWAFLLSGVVQAIFAIGQFMTQTVGGSKWLGMTAHFPHEATSSVVGVEGVRWLRAYGTLPHPNILGGFLVVCLAFALFLYFYYKPGWQKIISAASLVFISVGLFFSFSRSAWLAFLLVFGLWFLFSVLKKRTKEIILPTVYLVLTFVCLLAIYFPLITTRFLADDTLEKKSIDYRTYYLTDAKNVITARPILGTGIGDYVNNLQVVNPDKDGWYYQPVHNTYLMILAELGLIGFAVFILLLIYAGIVAFKVLSKNPLSLCLLVALLVVALFDHYLWTTYFGLTLLWLILALILRDSPQATGVIDTKFGGWDKAAKDYSKFIGEQGDPFRLILINPYLAEKLKSMPVAQVLDLGCGEGYLSRLFTSEGISFTGVDFSQQLINEAKNKNTPGELLCADICADLPLVENFYDLVVSNMTMMDVDNLASAYQNAYKFLKPGGEFIVTILHPAFSRPSGRFYKTFLDKVLRRDPFFRSDGYGQEFFSFGKIKGTDSSTKVHHRSISTYVKSALGVGFKLKDMDELIPSELDLKRVNQPLFLAKYPAFLVLTFVKENNL